MVYKMRIAFITFEYPPDIGGGAGIYAEFLTKQLAKKGHQVYVYTPDSSSEPPTDIPPNIFYRPVSTLSYLPTLAPQFWVHLPSAIRADHEQVGFDLIHINGLSYSFHTKLLPDVPIVLTIHHVVNRTQSEQGDQIRSEEFNIIMRYIEKIGVKIADKLISVSIFTKEDLLSNYAIDPRTVKVVYNGADHLAKDITEENRTTVRQRFSLKDSTVITFVGRIDDQRKGAKVLLEAIPKISNDNFKVLFVGKGDQEGCKSLAREIGVEDDIVFTGFVTENTLKEIYSISDIYVCPSKLEGFGFTILEALLYDCPVVASRVGAIQEIADNLENVQLVPPNSPKELGDRISIVLDNKPQSEINSETILREFNWAKTASGTINTYRELLDKSRQNNDY